jgi:hypothetical protein
MVYPLAFARQPIVLGCPHELLFAQVDMGVPQSLV